MTNAITYDDGPAGDKRQNLQRQLEAMRSEQSSWLTQWRDLADYILPYRPKFQTTDRNRGDRRNLLVIDSTATFAARTLGSGLMSGVSSPTRPWFRYTPTDLKLRDNDAVKEWLSEVEDRVREVFLRSNLYDSLAMVYGDLGVFGTACMAILEDDDTILRCQVFPVGSYFLATNDRGIVDTMFREMQMTVRQVVDRFGIENVSVHVKDLWNRGSYNAWVDVVHAVVPNELYDESMLAAKHKKFHSCYFEPGQRDKDFLSESGFDMFPVVAPRWETVAEDIYGISPAMVVIGDVKALQTLQKRKAQAVEKKVNPPMVGPSSMRNSKASLLPGEITYVDGNGGTDSFHPAFDVNFDLVGVEKSIYEHQERIRRGLYEDLFLMLAMNDQRQPVTAEEIRAKQEEKMLILGPVLEKLNGELYNPLHERVLDILWKRGELPDPPDVMRGQSLKVEYVSIMAQAQRMVGIVAIDRLVGFVGNVSAKVPEVLDKIDADRTIDQYAEMLGVNPKVLVSDEKVAALRQKRAQIQAQQAANAAASQQAQTAQVLSQTDTARKNGLTDLIRSQTGQVAQ